MEKKVLITGGYSFMGRAVAACFQREGWEIHILGQKDARAMDSLSFAHRLHEYTVIDERCKEVFRVQNFDLVVHMAESSMNWDDAAYLKNMGMNFLGLFHMLALSTEFGVKKFILVSLGASSADGAASGSLRQQRKALQKQELEGIAVSWGKRFSLPVAVLRFATVYGPGQLADQGFVGEFIEASIRGERYKIGVTEAERRDFLYVDDAAYAVLRAAERDYAGGVLSVCSGVPVSFTDFLLAAEEAFPLPVIERNGSTEGRYGRAIMDPAPGARELGWKPHVFLREGLRKTYAWYMEYIRRSDAAQREAGKQEARKAWRDRILPWGENIALFALAAAIAVWQGGSTINQTIGLDFNYLYIMAMGLLYGKTQSILAVILSLILLSVTSLQKGLDIATLLYLPSYLLHFATYLFIGVLTSYVTDSRDRELEDAEYHLKRLQERYAFFEENYEESIAIKDRLYRQIANSDDSIGRIYRITSRLESIELENVFTQAISVLSELLEADHIAIYVRGANAGYFRMKIRQGKATESLPRSLKVTEHSYLEQMLKDRKMFVNRALIKGLPDIATPIVSDGMVIAVIEIYALDFDFWSYARQNMLSITARLISAAVGRAYFYESSMRDRRYLPDTMRILTEEEYQKVVDEIEKRVASPKTAVSLVYLNLDVKDDDWQLLDEKLASVVRAEDYVGRVGDRAQLLLIDANEDNVKRVRERLDKMGVANAPAVA